MRASPTKAMQKCPFVHRAAAAFSIGLTSLSIYAAPVDISTPVFTQVFNDRIGASRFFTGAGTDRVRVSTYVSPSPDSDFYNGTSNGGATTVTVTHPNFGTISPNPRVLDFVGFRSTGGGALNQYTTIFNPGASLLSAWDAIPFSITVSNPLAPNVSSVTYNAPDFDRNALPPFVTNLSLTGGGLNPRLDWTIPATGVTPTSVRIQIREIKDESADGRRITDATLVHSKTLPAGTTSYTVNELFTNRAFTHVDGLVTGKKYEIAVLLDLEAGGDLKGRSRTFFEFSPLLSGDSQVTVYLPSVQTDGSFKFDVPVTTGEQISLDPVVAIGYEYQIGSGDPLFQSVQLPNIGDGLFDLFLFNGTDWLFASVLNAGSQYFFSGPGVDRFRILGIETSAGLDPTDTTAFITTVSFAGDGRFTGTMRALTANVPEPGTFALIGIGLAGLLASRRRHAGEKLAPAN